MREFELMPSTNPVNAAFGLDELVIRISMKPRFREGGFVTDMPSF
jgi:hypothetical protein